METKKLDIEVKLSEVEDKPLYKGVSVKGTAKVFIKDFGFRLNIVPWKILDGKIFVTFVSWENKINGKAKRFPIVHFLDKKTSKQVCSAVKSEIEPHKKRLEWLAREAKKRKKERVKLKKKQKRFNELRAFFAMPEKMQNDILLDIWKKGEWAFYYRRKRLKKCKTEQQIEERKKLMRERFAAWKPKHIEKMKGLLAEVALDLGELQSLEK